MQFQDCSLIRIMPGGSLVDPELPVATVTALVPFCPSLEAVIVAGPANTPVTSPATFTVATGRLLLTHVTLRPVRTLPPASRSVVANCCVAPTGRFAVAGFTVTDATGAVDDPVVPLATLERLPNTAFTFNVPRN